MGQHCGGWRFGWPLALRGRHCGRRQVLHELRLEEAAATDGNGECSLFPLGGLEFGSHVYR